MSVTTPSKLEKILAAGHFGVTSECGPPRSAEGTVVDEKARLVGPYVDVINVTDNQTAVVRMSSLASCIRIKQLGFEPVLQMTTRDRNRIGLQSDLLGAGAFGINNVLCLTGDHQRFGDHPNAANVFDLDSTQLIQTVKQMRDEGKLLSGYEMNVRPKCSSERRKTPSRTRLKSACCASLKKWPQAPSLFRPSASITWQSSKCGCSRS